MTQVKVYNKTLEPNLWDKDQKLDPEVRLRLLKVGKDFYDALEFKSEVTDILMLGSCVNYTWTPQSDIDVHVVMDISKEGIKPDEYRKFFDNIGGNFNKEHEIEIEGHPVEVYLQDISEKNSTAEQVTKHGAIYSLLHDKWIVPPKYEPPTLNKDAIKKAFHEFKDQIDSVIKSGDVDKLKALMKSIRAYRKKGVEGEGEFSVENITFKALRHTGLLEKLKDAITKMYDRAVSLEEMESYLNKLNDLPDNVADEIITEMLDELETRDKPYLIIGSVDERGEVYAVKSEKTDKLLAQNQPYDTHHQLKNKYDIHHLHVLDWRYRSDTNEIVYYDYPSEVQSTAVKEWLKANCAILSEPKVYVSKEVNRELHRRFHDLDYKYQADMDEVVATSPSFIVTGMISWDLDVTGDKYQKGQNPITHGDLKSWYGNWNNSIDWRYFSDENVVYYKEREPNEQQKEVISEYLRGEFDVERNPRFLPMTPEKEYKQLPSWDRKT